MNAVTFHVICPVCREKLEFEHNGDDAWGTIPITDLACAEVTMHDSAGLVDRHMAAHRKDGSWFKALMEHYKTVGESYLTAYDRLHERTKS